VTENWESTTLLESFEEETAELTKKSIRYERLITYGVALRVAPVADWLKEHLASPLALIPFVLQD